MSKDKRRKLIVNRRFQLAFVLRLVLLEIATVLISAFLTAFFIFYILHDTTISAGAWGETFAFNIVLLIAGLLIWVLWRGVISSHRIAGPAYRLGIAFKQFAKGNTSVRISLREKDELKPLAEEFNRFANAVEEKNNQIIKILTLARTEIEKGNKDKALELIDKIKSMLTRSKW